VQKDSATPSLVHFRLLSDAMEELCSARTQEEVVRISAELARKACNVDSISIVLTSGDQFHYAPGDRPDSISQSVRSKVIVRMSALAVETSQTAVVPDIHRDERTRSHTNGSTFARSLVVVPVGGRIPFAAITYAWAQERWPGATDVLVLEALARAAGLALIYRGSQAHPSEISEHDSVNKWLENAVDAEGLRGSERQHRVARISALARTQGFAMRRPGAGINLEELVDAELIAHAAREGKVKTAGPPVRLGLKAAETVALALHELATNAVKFGALSVPEGRITVAWRKETDREDPCVRLEWLEEGVPSCTQQALRRGFGLDLIERTVPYDLRGASHISFEPGGVHCVIDIPLTRDNVVSDQPAIVE